MKRCPNCRAKFDPTFSLHCPECGTSIDPSVRSMTVPEPRSRASEDITGMPTDDGLLGEDGVGAAPAGSGVFVRRLGVRALIAVAALGVGAISSLVGGSAPFQPAETTLGVAAPVDPSVDHVNAAELAVGDCVLWPEDDGETFETLARVECLNSHDAEVFALIAHPAAPETDYPGNDMVADWGVQACYERFAGYVGRTYEEATELEYTFFTPTELGWTKYDDRAVQCIVFRVDEADLVGSLQAGA